MSQLLLACCRDPVELCTLIALTLLPFRADPALALQAMQSRIQRPSLNLQHLSRVCAKSLHDAISVLWTPLQRLENKHVQRSLQYFHSVLVSARPGHDADTLLL